MSVCLYNAHSDGVSVEWIDAGKHINIRMVPNLNSRISPNFISSFKTKISMEIDPVAVRQNLASFALSHSLYYN